jgi:hypothetical protein
VLIRDPGKRHIAWFDVHVPKQNDLTAPLGFAHDVGCDYFIIGGDFLNLEWASHWNEKVFAEIGRGQLRKMLFQEIEAGEKVIASIRKAVGPKTRLLYIPGNHEEWLWFACFYHRIVEVPWTPESITFKSDVAKILDSGLSSLLTRLLNAKKYGLTILPYNEPLKIGSLVYLHGHQFGGSNPTAASAKRWPHVNLVYGHHHSHEVRTIHNGGDTGKVYQHTLCPALCGLMPGYLRDRSTRWLNGFWHCRFDNGIFDGNVVKVLDGRIIK